MRDTLPPDVRPMLATSGTLPDDADRWGLELKWDGVRAMVHVGEGRVRAVGRSAAEVTGQYPELEVVGDLLPDRTAVIDGEVVAFDDRGLPSLQRLRHRTREDRPDARLVRYVPVHYIAFDLPYLDGRALYDLPYHERRALLEDLDLAAGPIEAPPYLPGADAEQVRELLDYTREQGLDGLVAKRLDSPYRPGRRVDFWRKVRNFRTRQVVIAGWKTGQGRREGGLGSLLLGVYDDGGLRFVGDVGTGFTDAALDDLQKVLSPLERRTSPYTGPVPQEHADARWVEPWLAGEIAFTGWTDDGLLWRVSWRGLRPDIDPGEVRRDPAD